MIVFGVLAVVALMLTAGGLAFGQAAAMVAILFALFYALIRGLEAMWHSVRDAFNDARSVYAEKRAARRALRGEAVDAGFADKTRKGGRATGYAAGATVRGSGVHLQALWRGIREGWAEGRERVYRLRDHTVDYVPDEGLTPTAKDPDPAATSGSVVDAPTDEPTNPNQCTAIVPGDPKLIAFYQRAIEKLTDQMGEVPAEDTTARDTQQRRIAQYQGRIDRETAGHRCPNPVEADQPEPKQPFCREHFPATKEEEPSMTAATDAAATPVYGEVNTLADLERVLTSIEREALADHEEAKADEARAAQEMEAANHEKAAAGAEIRGYEAAVIAKMVTLKLDKESMAELQQLLDSAKVRKADAEKRMAVAEQALAVAKDRAKHAGERAEQAKAARVNTTKRHNARREAHVSAPTTSAETPFYQE